MFKIGLIKKQIDLPCPYLRLPLLPLVILFLLLLAFEEHFMLLLVLRSQQRQQQGHLFRSSFPLYQLQLGLLQTLKAKMHPLYFQKHQSTFLVVKQLFQFLHHEESTQNMCSKANRGLVYLILAFLLALLFNLI